jgi:hypothetical protein
MAGGQRLISWLHPCSTSNVALNTRTYAHGPLMGHPNWAGCDISISLFFIFAFSLSIIFFLIFSPSFPSYFFHSLLLFFSLFPYHFP